MSQIHRLDNCIILIIISWVLTYFSFFTMFSLPPQLFEAKTVKKKKILRFTKLELVLLFFYIFFFYVLILSCFLNYSCDLYKEMKNELFFFGCHLFFSFYFWFVEKKKVSMKMTWRGKQNAKWPTLSV